MLAIQLTCVGMDDREIAEAIAAGDLDGLADAYGKHAESLFGYCCWMLGDQEDAADAVQDTFVIAAGRLRGLSDPRKLRPWLYAVARNECLRRLGPAEPGLDPGQVEDLADQADDHGDSAERAGLRLLIRTALDELNAGEREVIELGLRHDLHGADLAAVLGVPRNQAHALASRAHGQLEKALGALLVARTGRRACPELDQLLDGWDGQLTVLTRKRVSRHIDQCGVCADRRHGALEPAALYGMAAPAALPPGLDEEVLRLCSDSSPETLEYRQDVTYQAGPFRPNGFPEPVRPRRLALSGIAAVAAIVIAIAATGIITALALGVSHAPRPADAARPSSPAGASGTAAAGPASGPSPGLAPATSAAAVTSAPPAASPPSPSTASAKPSPSPSSSAAASARPTPPSSTSSPTPRPTFTIPVTPTAAVQR